MAIKWNVRRTDMKVLPLRKYIISVSDGPSLLLEKRFFGVLFPRLMWKRLAKKIYRKMIALSYELKAARLALAKAPK